MSWLANASRIEGPLGGLAGGAGPCVLASLPPGWIVTPTREDAEVWLRALRFFGADALPYPADDGRPFDGVSPDPSLPRERLAARDAWTDPSRKRRPFVVLPAKALLLRVPVSIPTLELVKGARLDRGATLRWLGAHGYLVAQKVQEPATAAVRGGVIDLWPANAGSPVRIELFDDEIEGMRAFDPETQRSGARVARVRVLAAREAPLHAEAAERAARYLAAVAAEVDRPGEYRSVLTDFRNGIWFPGAEDYLPALAELGPLDLPAPAYVVEPELCREELRRAQASVTDRWAALEPEDRPLVRPADRYGPPPPLAGRPITTLGGPFATTDNRALRVGTTLDPLVKQLRTWASDGRAVTIVVETAARAERVRGLFSAHDLDLPAGRAAPGSLSLEVGDLPHGFTADDVVFVTADELFGDRLHAPKAAAASAGTAAFRRATRPSFASVQRGDLVVHTRHGIGMYTGIARLPLGVGEGDFLLLEYRDGAKLYVPIHRLDLVTPYVAEGPRPRLDRLGRSTWETRKAKVREAVLQLASDLLLLYARRALVTAPAYEGLDEDYLRFEEAFPYLETPDQETAIHDVLADLASGKPMDRLLIGDVGFGKTEVAMRAAMRVVQGGGQVAVLTPTSVLALQHGETFRQRFAGQPVRVETLSRLRPETEAKEVRADLAKGKVNIVIGTTTLLGGGIRFRNLALVVVDEEHRFGTKQKEQLKRLTTGVHSLAMSATPIPRTLQMAISGMRGLSVLTTPPQGRLRIRTEVVRFSPARVREDVLYELRRGGQVFFVHNRVQSIQGVARWLGTLVPEASIVVAHGQMEDKALEATLARFIRAEANVLVSTAIIESGIDLPLVNTMIINRAETLGLAQLYQLRGRIGRGTVRGHCTVLVAGTGASRKTSIDRLKALQEHTEFGANFGLAARDLELRGSGEILGDKQHGHIAAIGFDAYLELLEEAVGRARGEVAAQTLDPDVEIPVHAAIPDEWIPDVPERLDAYQRLALARTRAQARGEIEALEQRYGPAPEAALNLGWLTEARIRCRDLGIERFALQKAKAVLRLHPRSRVGTTTVDALCRAAPNRFKRVGETEIEVRFSPDEAQLPFRLLDWICARLEAPPPRV